MNLVAENLSYKPDEQFHLNEVSFNFKKGNLYTILGRTLSGKTTLLKTIAGLLTPDSGSIQFEDKDFLKIYIDFPRQDLIKRINTRVDKMFKEGAINEVKKFLKLNIKKDKSPSKIIGINEIKKYLSKEIDLMLAKELIAIKTRQYAKRQNTWARNKMSSWNEINPKDFQYFFKKIHL